MSAASVFGFYYTIHYTIFPQSSGPLWKLETKQTLESFSRRGGTGLGGQPGAAAGALDGSGTARTRRRAHDTREGESTVFEIHLKDSNARQNAASSSFDMKICA